MLSVTLCKTMVSEVLRFLSFMGAWPLDESYMSSCLDYDNGILSLGYDCGFQLSFVSSLQSRPILHKPGCMQKGLMFCPALDVHLLRRKLVRSANHYKI